MTSPGSQKHEGSDIRYRKTSRKADSKDETVLARLRKRLAQQSEVQLIRNKYNYRPKADHNNQKPQQEITSYNSTTHKS